MVSKKDKGGQIHLLNDYRDHPIFLGATTSLSKVKVSQSWSNFSILWKVDQPILKSFKII